VKKLGGVNRPSIILVVASVVLCAGLASLALAVSLQGHLKETQGQLRDVQGQLEETQGQLQKIQEPRTRQQNTAKGGEGPAGKESSTPSTTSKIRTQDNAKSQSKHPEGSLREGEG
jgi:hypothetical protein